MSLHPASDCFHTLTNFTLGFPLEREQRNVMKESALIRAAHNGHLAVVKRLMAAGAVVDAIDLVRGVGRGDIWIPALLIRVCQVGKNRV